MSQRGMRDDALQFASVRHVHSNVAHLVNARHASARPATSSDMARHSLSCDPTMIDASIMKSVLEACARGELVFQEMLSKLDALGVERYQADLVRSETSLFVANGSLAVAGALVRTSPARTLSPVGVEVASRALFRRRIGYDEFRERIATAGCVGYMVSIAGLRCAYFGRLGASCGEMLPRSVWPPRMSWSRRAMLRPLARSA